MELYCDVTGAEERRSSGALMRFVVRDERAEHNETLGATVREKLKSWLPGREPIEALRQDAARVAFDMGDSLCTVIADCIANVLEQEREKAKGTEV